MSTLKTPDSSERPTYGTVTERLPGGQIVTVTPDGRRRVVDPEETPLTAWPSDNPPSKSGK
jgi:hypothetical protein